MEIYKYFNLVQHEDSAGAISNIHSSAYTCSGNVIKTTLHCASRIFSKFTVKALTRSPLALPVYLCCICMSMYMPRIFLL